MNYADIDTLLRGQGLIPRGGFHPEERDGVPPLSDGRPTRTLLLAGNAGPGMWQAFSAAPGFHTTPDPLDRWGEDVLNALAAQMNARALFPFGGPPHLPFVAWAKRAEAVAESPLGILVHPDYGLWHAYRGALAFAETIDLPPRDTRPRPCDSCVDKPCLSTCPVGAFTGESYEVQSCAHHIAAPAGAACMENGCGARLACPVGRGYVYSPAQARFHMEAFLRARQSEAAGP